MDANEEIEEIRNADKQKKTMLQPPYTLHVDVQWGPPT